MFIALSLIAVQTGAAPNWIWAPGAKIPPHVSFRRDLILPQKPEKADLAITCDDAYVLYVNGKEAARHASWYTMQDVDLRQYLHMGRNVLAVEARNIESVAGLLVVGEIRVGASRISLASGTDWRYSLQEPAGWRDAGFDDSAWPAPHVIGPLGIAPWYKPVDEGVALRTMLDAKPVSPMRILPPMTDSPDLARRYVWPSPATGPGGKFQTMRIEPVKGAESVGKVFAGPHRFTVDFGRELAGWVEVTVESEKAPDLTIETAESNDRFASDSMVCRNEGGRWVFRILPPDGFTGFRFARIDLKGLDTPVRIKSVTALWRLWPANYVGSFACSDEVLNRIWEMGAYTVRLNLDPKALGAILVPARGDRYPWMGDDRVAHRVLFDCFGDYWLAKADLDFFVQPGQKPIDVNGIPGYTLDWVIGLYDYWMASGDAAEVRKHLDDVATIIAQYAEPATPKGWLFTDWEPALQATTDPSVTAFHVKYVQAAQLAAKMATAFGQEGDARQYRADAAKRLEFLKKRPDWPTGLPQHALSDALIAGVGDRFPDTVPANTTTPYFTYYVLEALSAAGRSDRALEALRQYWKGMLDLGATSTWEYFLPDWAHRLKPSAQPPDEACGPISKCHPWSAGATAWLSDHVLGATPTSPGWTTCQIKPFFGNLAWAKGSVPTPHGPVQVSWTKQPGGHILTFTTPADVQPTVVLSAESRCFVDRRVLKAEQIRNGLSYYPFSSVRPVRVSIIDAN